MSQRLTQPRTSADQTDRRVNLFVDVLQRLSTPGVVELPDGTRRMVGNGEPVWRVRFRTDNSLSLPRTEYSLGSAYVRGELDFDGDLVELLEARDHLRKGVAPSVALRFAVRLMLRSPTKANAAAINRHYTLGDDFYLTFIDKRYRFYSQCIFRNDDDCLEDAAEYKLESMWNSLKLRPGMRLLDIGGGWGGVTQYCGERGVHVTSLTLVEDSAAYIRRLITEYGLSGEVIVQDALDHRPSRRYDHAVIYGVIEHIPNYRQFCARIWEAVAPGGRLYLDASATKQKFAVSPFTRQYTWPGHHSFLSLQDIVRELLLHGFEIVEVKRETRDYELTIRHWADRLEANHSVVTERWGEGVYRAFRMFLRGGQYAFQTNRLQAYHLVAERRPEAGPRPSLLRRAADFVASLQ